MTIGLVFRAVLSKPCCCAHLFARLRSVAPDSIPAFSSAFAHHPSFAVMQEGDTDVEPVH